MEQEELLQTMNYYRKQLETDPDNIEYSFRKRLAMWEYYDETED